MECMELEICMSDKYHRYYKHTKFRQNPRGDPKFLVDLTWNDPIDYVESLVTIGCIDRLVTIDCIDKLVTIDYIDRLVTIDCIDKLVTIDYIDRLVTIDCIGRLVTK